MRESFIKLLQDDPCDSMHFDCCAGCPYEFLLGRSETRTEGASCIEISGSCFEARYADHLIANGAIIPPVDIGDKVWYIEGAYYNSSRLIPREIEVTEISKKKCGDKINWAFIANGTRYKFTSLGRSVFLTKEACVDAIERKIQKLMNKKSTESEKF